MNKDLEKFIPIFNEWKGNVDKIMKDNQADIMYCEHEFYDHLIKLYENVNNGITLEDSFTDEILESTKDYVVAEYNIIPNLINAINDFAYTFKENKFFRNQKVMFIDDTYTIENKLY